MYPEKACAIGILDAVACIAVTSKMAFCEHDHAVTKYRVSIQCRYIGIENKCKTAASEGRAFQRQASGSDVTTP
jgi:hypothetical protein